MRILIVEDQDDVRKLLRMTLAPCGWEVAEAGNGPEGMRLAAELRPEVAILDVMLPGGVTGLQICEAIKADPLTRATRVIILSARGQRRDIEAGLDVQADHYLVKPFSPLELIEVIRRINASLKAVECKNE